MKFLTWDCHCGRTVAIGFRCGCGKKLYFHVFTDNHDEYFDSYRDACKCYIKWKHDYGCVRMWTYIDDGHDGEDENCIKSFGEFPR